VRNRKSTINPEDMEVEQMTIGNGNRVIDLEKDVAVLKVTVDNVDKKTDELHTDIKELHSRISTQGRDIVNKLDDMQKDALDQHMSIRNEMKTIDDKVSKLEQWKWTLIGAAVVVGWLISHIDIGSLFK
jgi:predicted  nucleic acid-binding Zn-ribbon protein